MTQTLAREVSPKGLKDGALNYAQSVGVGIASTAPAYSLAATLGFVVAVIGVQTPAMVIIAFVPMFLAAWAIKQMNAIDPDCGTSFTWAWRSLGPRTGWFAGGFGTVAADLLVMASQSQIAGQYLFLLIGVGSIGNDASSVWVLLVGVLWIVVLSWICYRGIEISARLQVTLVVVEVLVLLALAITALVRVLIGTAPPGHIDPSLSWFDPFKMSSFSAFGDGLLLMVFIYWGWDTTTSINEETEDPGRIPGNAGVASTGLLLVTYLLVTLSVQAFAGIGTHGIGLGNPAHVNDVLSGMGTAVFGHSAVGQVMYRLLLLMVLTSSAATTQTTILPNARTTLSMAFHKAVPPIFGRIHPRYKTPTFSTISFAVAAIFFYVAVNFVSHGNVLSDSVTAATFFVALYLGITGFACAWHFRRSLQVSVEDFISKFVVPLLSGVILFALLGYNIYFYTAPDQSYTEVNVFGWHLGGVLLIGIVTTLFGLAAMIYCRRTSPEFFENRAARYGPSLTELGDVVEIAGQYQSDDV